MIPRSLGDLGLSQADRYSHAVWDIGAEALARALSARLDAPLVLSRVSRLVFDCNRPPDAADGAPWRTERIAIAGNEGLSDALRAARVAEVYVAFHEQVAKTLAAFAEAPLLVTIHSFTPIWNDVARPTEIGLLHDADPSLARAMLRHAGDARNVELNVPYSAADGVTHTLQRHAAAARANAMIEVRNDLLSDEAGVGRTADAVEAMLRGALGQMEAAA